MVTAKRARALRKLYCEQGKSLRDIAALYRTTASTVHRWMDEAGIERRGPGRQPVDLDLAKLCEMREQGASLTRLSIEFQVAEVTLTRHLKRAGLYSPKTTLVEAARRRIDLLMEQAGSEEDDGE